MRTDLRMTPLERRLVGSTALVLGIVSSLVPLATRAQDRGPGRMVQEKDKAESKEKKEQAKKKAQPLPLNSDRTIEFTTDEGTWVSLDVAPDGKTIVFELLG